MVPSLPAASRPCRTTSNACSFAPHMASCRSKSSSPSFSRRFAALACVMPSGGSAEMSSRRTLAPFFVKTLSATGLTAGLAADHVPDMVAVFMALHRLLDLQAARPRHLDLHLFPDAPRTRAQHDHPIAEIDRFLDIVRHEDNGLPGALPKPRDLLLHSLARLRIERAERLGPHKPLGV